MTGRGQSCGGQSPLAPFTAKGFKVWGHGGESGAGEVRIEVDNQYTCLLLPPYHPLSSAAHSSCRYKELSAQCESVKVALHDTEEELRKQKSTSQVTQKW